MLQQLVNWLGPTRTRLLAALLAGTALGNLILQIMFHDEAWAFPAQVGLIWLFVLGLALTLSARLPARGRRRLWLALGPGLLLIGLGVLFPNMALFLGGGGLGWMVAAQIVLRNRVRMEYQAAIRHLRHSEYDAAIRIMDDLIQAETGNPDHYRFRAELHRLANRLDKARIDYEAVVSVDPDAVAGYTGLAEVYAQQGDYETAREYARQALERAPRQWMAAYNLGMIEDRLADADAALKHLNIALASGIPHSRYRLLTRLWLARNYYRTGQLQAARAQLDLLRKQASGLRDWQTVLQSEQASPLRAMLEADVQLAQRFLDGDASLEALQGE